MKKKFIICMSVVMLVVAMAAVTAFADEETGVTITGDDLSGGGFTFEDFDDVILDGNAQTTDATWSIGNIIDARGTGEGWRLTFSLSIFQEYALGVYVDGGRVLMPGSVTILTPPVAHMYDVTSSPETTITSVTAGTALDAMPAAILLSAAENGGMGSYTVDPMEVRLTVRADAYAATYRANAIVSLQSGPTP